MRGIVFWALLVFVAVLLLGANLAVGSALGVLSSCVAIVAGCFSTAGRISAYRHRRR